MRQKKPDDFEPTSKYPDGHSHLNKPRCQAWSPRQARQCMAIAMPNGKCRVHGGGSPTGIAAPNYKHGKYSKTLPRRLIENYEIARGDPEYLKLQDEISLLDSRLLELTGSIDGKTSSIIFDELSDAVNRMEKAQGILVRSQNILDEEQRQKVREKANADFAESINDIARLVKSGAREWHIWNDIATVIEHRRRLVETERKLLVDMQMLINTQDVLVLLDAIMESVRRNVTDKSIRAEVQKDFVRLTTK